MIVAGSILGISNLSYEDESLDVMKFQNQDGYMVYDDPDYDSIIGIDVSSHQGDIDWALVAQNNRIEFAMIRCGYRGGIEGLRHDDEYFDYNMTQAANNGIKTGVYYYSSANTMEELEEDARFVLEKIQNYTFDYPVVFDMEIYDEINGRINSLSVEEKTRFALRFCEIMEENGYQPMIYGNLDWLYNHLDFSQIKYEIWYAAYQSYPAMEDSFTMWQYSNAGQVTGISTNVDMNVWLEKKED